MDETPVSADMVTDTTVESVDKKDIPIKTAGHEKIRVSVCLAVKGETKMKQRWNKDETFHCSCSCKT